MPLSSYGDLHSALKTEILGHTSSGEVTFFVVKLYRGRNDFIFSLHAASTEYSTHGIQTTDFLSYIGLHNDICTFVPQGQCYCRQIGEGFQLDRFVEAFGKSFQMIQLADKRLSACGFTLDQPEGWKYYFPVALVGTSHSSSRPFYSGNGHTALKSELQKTCEDDSFLFALSYIDGGSETNRGWIFHFHPKHSPVSQEVASAIKFLKLVNFKECPFFDFEECYWRFALFHQEGTLTSVANAELVNIYFSTYPQSFSLGIKALIEADALLKPFGLHFLPDVEIKQAAPPDLNAHIEDKISAGAAGPVQPSQSKSRPTETYRSQLRQNLVAAFNDSELRDLCFDMNVDYETLNGENKADKARELIAFCERRQIVRDLAARCRELRPNVLWEGEYE